MVQRHQVDQQRIETLGPAERIIQTLLSYTDHAVHNRPGVVFQDLGTNIGVRWEPATWKEENGQKVVYRFQKVGNKHNKIRVGILDGNKVMNNGVQVAEYRKPGLFPEVVVWMYNQIAEVYKLDNEFVARWASWAFSKEHRDLKVILAAFLLVQNRCGEPVTENGKVLFHDEDYRNIGEAMCLLRCKNDINPKLLLRIGDILNLPGVAAINRELGFGKSARNPAIGRYYKVIEKWLKHREDNPKMLDGLVNASFRTSVMELSRRAGYKPSSSKFFEVLRWKQVQAKDGRREIAIGAQVKKAEDWSDFSEKQICERIIELKPNYKKIVGLLPGRIGLTKAIMAAAIEAGSLSDNDLIIYAPTLEELGLLEIKEISDRWEKATKNAENQRANNIAQRMKSQKAREVLEEAADNVAKKAIAEVVKDLRIYVLVDSSGSMQGAIERAKACLSKLLVGFPLDKIHCATFNTIGREIEIKHPSSKGVEMAFRGCYAGGGTCYAAGINVLAKHLPKENEDSIIFFIGDELDLALARLVNSINVSNINPMAFGLLKVISPNYGSGTIVTDAASMLKIPCFNIDESMFDDPYSVTRIIRNLIATTPVREKVGPKVITRKTLVEEILGTKLLEKPIWA